MDKDQFGHDPQVRFLRRAFAGMELAQGNLLEGLGISQFDERLSRIRTASLKLFEKVWMTYSRWGLSPDEKEMTDVYIHCFAHILSAYRISIPPGLINVNEKVINIIREVSK